MHLHFEWSRDSALVLQILTHTSFSRVSNVVICGYYNSFNMNWRGVSGRQEELLHLSIHNLTWQNIGRFVNHNISIQSKIVQELFEDV